MTVWTYHPCFEMQPHNFLWANPFYIVPVAESGCPQDWWNKCPLIPINLTQKETSAIIVFSTAQNTRQCKRYTDYSYLPPFLIYFLHPLLISRLLEKIAGNFSQEYFQFCPQTSRESKGILSVLELMFLCLSQNAASLLNFMKRSWNYLSWCYCTLLTQTIPKPVTRPDHINMVFFSPKKSSSYPHRNLERSKRNTSWWKSDIFSKLKFIRFLKLKLTLRNWGEVAQPTFY